MTLSEMLAQRDKVSADYMKAQNDTASIFAAEEARHAKKMKNLREKALPLIEQQALTKSAFEKFHQKTFGEIVIDTQDREWQMRCWRAGKPREWYNRLAWFRVMSDVINSWWTLDIGFQDHFTLKHNYSQTKLGPGRLSGQPTSYRFEGMGFKHHFGKVKELMTSAGITLIDREDKT